MLTHDGTSPLRVPLGISGAPVYLAPSMPAPPPRPLLRRLFPPWLSALGTGLALYLAVYGALLITDNPMYIPTLIAIGSLTVPVAFLVYVARATGGHRIPSWTVAMCAIWGGVLGTVMAGLLETDTLRTLGVLPTPLIGLTEESVKLIVPVVLLLTVRKYAHREIDGIVVGVAVGMGFAVFETMGYGFVTLLASQGNVHTVDHVLLIRALMAPAGHIAWTGLACAALWRVGIHRTPRALLGFLATFALVITLHTLWDALAIWWIYLPIAVVSLGLLHRRLRKAAVSESPRLALIH